MLASRNKAKGRSIQKQVIGLIKEEGFDVVVFKPELCQAMVGACSWCCSNTLVVPQAKLCACASGSGWGRMGYVCIFRDGGRV